MGTETTVVPEKPTHPLAKELVLKDSESLEEWERDWKSENRYLRKRNLLHIGWFGGSLSQVCFYFELADGCNSSPLHNPFEIPGEYSYARDPGRQEQIEARRDLSGKAFQILCEQFFKDERRDFEAPSWLKYFEHMGEPLLRKVMWFLRCHDDWHGWPGLYNLGQRDENHLQKTFRQFAQRFARFTWEFKGFPDSRGRERMDEGSGGEHFRRVLDELEPERVQLLAGLGMLRILTARDDFNKKIKYPLTAVGLAKLREIALAIESPFPDIPWDKRRKPKTIEEAAYAGSPAAEVLLLLGIANKETERFADLAREKERAAQAEREAEEARARVKALS